MMEPKPRHPRVRRNLRSRRTSRWLRMLYHNRKNKRPHKCRVAQMSRLGLLRSLQVHYNIPSVHVGIECALKS